MWRGLVAVDILIKAFKEFNADHPDVRLVLGGKWADAAVKYKVATQMDNEGHATEGLRCAVEWLQSVEFYNALRFNGKNVILLSYPGEAHGLRNLENQKDFLFRIQAFTTIT
jgi:glycosyltransferase involved in cell wall biosynthesis